MSVTIVSRRNKPGWVVNLTDFANMVKAFIGSNYLSVAYAFKQSGLGLGIIGFIIIASLTDHCCHMIAKIKHHAIEKRIQDHKGGGRSKRKYYTVNSRTGTPNLDSGVDDDNSDSSDERDTAPLMGDKRDESDKFDDDDGSNESDEMREHMLKHMTYGDIGQLSFGKFGIGIVNFCIALTQFGFCVGYSIFIGNTISHLFPSQLCYTLNTTEVCSPFRAPDRLHMKRSANNTDFMNLNLPSTVLPDISELAPANYSNFTTLSPFTTEEPSNFTTLSPNTTTVNSTTADFIRFVKSTSPNLMILVAAPLPIFLCFALIRSVRYLGFISMLANSSILVGLVALIGFLISGFKVQEFHWFEWAGFPVFFGMVTGSFEGIGLVIPIESSMEGNRELFPSFLHGAVLILTMILGGFGIMGYLKYGVGTEQMLNKNLPPGNPLSIAVNIGICLGILLTFPLQIFPVIEILEKYLFAEGRICGPKRDESSSERTQLTEEDNEPLMEDVAVHIPASVPAWKRNILRIFVVLCASGFAVLLKDNFAYVGAFVGAVGSSVLAYILPCLFHLKICWHDINNFIKLKDIIIVVFGIIASVVSVVTVVQAIVHNTKV